MVTIAAVIWVLDQVADYNQYDCVSTLRLRDGLLGVSDSTASLDW